jgi:hypothetical protein
MTQKPKRSLGDRIRSIFGAEEKESDDAYERTMHKLGIDVLKDQKLEQRVKLLIEFEDYMESEIKTDDLIPYVKELKHRQDLLNHALYEISAPYGRAGDIPRFGKMFHGWGRLNASASSWILRTFDIVSRTEKAKEEKEKQDREREERERKQAEADKAKDAKKKDAVQGEAKTEEKPKTEEERDDIEDLLQELEIESVEPLILVQSLHDDLVKHIWKDGFLILGQCFLDRDVSPRASTVIQNVNAMREREDMTDKQNF